MCPAGLYRVATFQLYYSLTMMSHQLVTSAAGQAAGPGQYGSHTGLVAGTWTQSVSSCELSSITAVMPPCIIHRAGHWPENSQNSH